MKEIVLFLEGRPGESLGGIRDGWLAGRLAGWAGWLKPGISCVLLVFSQKPFKTQWFFNSFCGVGAKTGYFLCFICVFAEML